jgi:hypothetical protein
VDFEKECSSVRLLQTRPPAATKGINSPENFPKALPPQLSEKISGHKNASQVRVNNPHEADELLRLS